ncbi:FAD-dependent monooxygenase [Actinomycetospora straminea]|uniref:FAD-dependent oxidoreductase n=1 Tax=Actinomycetospora straminea TaxID=663607 RepID=A0ABP9E2M4_9PSEU|nr:FAD-dependent monooxygenase [Actinomycetospora straminea]MDD7931205.1 FAD-dependent monooxygenase [Actinomycetospora straminea]
MTDIVVVGGGPGGVLLTYLLARGGASVTLLESRRDFARRFRGDTLAPGVLEYLDTLGLARPLLDEVPHTRSDAFRWHTAERTWTLVDYRGASRRFPFYALIPQASFLPWLAERARAHGAEIHMGARFSALRHDADDPAGRVCGVEYSVDAVKHTLDAALVVGADGRNSKVRAASGLAATELGASLDILWHAFPRRADDPSYSGLDLFGTPTGSVALLDQGRDWQLGWTIRAGSLAEVRARGIGALRAAAVGVLPWLEGRLDDLDDVADLTLLPVRITTVESWTRPGLVLLGDAAHVVSPVGGNGINLALADAADLANRLIGPLRRTPPDPAQLDDAAAGLEVARRPAVEREQRGQVRTERLAARRIAQGDAGPPEALRALARVPGFPRLAGRRARVEVPAPVPVIAAGAP